jgi:trk system potassium uptake protein
MKKIISGYPLIVSYLAIFSILIGIINLLPLMLIIFMPQEIVHATHFLIPGLASIGLGLIVSFFFRGYEKGRLERNQDAILVTLIWMISIFISSMPFLLSGDYNFTHSIFETTSGFSTTGLTVVDVENSSPLFLLYRSLLQFFGGVGLVLVLTSAISDKFGMRLYSAEGHTDKLMPNLIRSARMILSIYIGYIVFGTIAFRIFGMSVFDAFNHSIAAVATGGFSTRALSIGHYDSNPIEIITIILMLLGGTNFLVHLRLLKGKFKDVLGHVEIKLLAILTLIFVPIFVINLLSTYNGQFGYTFRVAIFQFVSAITGTGYQTIPSFNLLPSTFIFGLIILMVLGAGLGSTAGGMKQYRVALAFKSLYWNFKTQMSHKKSVRSRFINRVGQKVLVESDEIKQNFAFIIVYMIVLVIGTLIFTSFGHDISDALFEFSSALGTVGLSVGIINYNAPKLLLWTGTVGMFFGRLEFYVVIIAIFKLVDDISKKKPNRDKTIKVTPPKET